VCLAARLRSPRSRCSLRAKRSSQCPVTCLFPMKVMMLRHVLCVAPTMLVSFSRLPALFWATAADFPAVAHIYIWCSIRHTPWLFSRTRTRRRQSLSATEPRRWWRRQSWIPYGAAEPILRLPTPTRKNRACCGPRLRVSKHFAARVARLRMARRSGEMDVDRERLPQT